MSREGRRHAEAGRPARRGDPSPAPFTYGAVPSTLIFGNVSSFAGGGAKENLGRPGGNQPSREWHSSLSRTRADDRGCSGSREEGIPLRTTPLRSSAHGTFALPTGSCSQTSAHVARHDGAAGRRKTARREEVVGSVDERSASRGSSPARPHPRQVRRGLVAKARAGAIPKRDNA